MKELPIKTWDASTFPEEVLSVFKKHDAELRAYFEFDEAHALDGSIERMENPNPSVDAYYRILEQCVPATLKGSSIHAYHYTRLLDFEVGDIKRNGVRVTTELNFRSRLSEVVVRGLLTEIEAAGIFTASPINSSEQKPGRLGKFWMTSKPHRTSDPGVSPLIGSWGGEVTHFWIKDPEVQSHLLSLGCARILEVSVPIIFTRHLHIASECITRNFFQGPRNEFGFCGFDLYSQVDLSPNHVLAIHTEGSEGFENLAMGVDG